MAGKSKRGIFISHSSRNADAAKRIEKALENGGFDVWLDDSDLAVGVLLRNELLEAIRKTRAVVLVWSDAASKSRWVSAEILTAFHMNRFILPGVVDDTPLPQFLGSSAYVDLRRGAESVRRIVRGADAAPDHANQLPPHVGAPSSDLRQACNRITLLQQQVTAPMMKRDLNAAAAAQHKLDPEMKAAEQRWRYDLTILNLGGYHRKNGYIIKHWDMIQAGRPPRDPLLHEGERLFFEAALVDPLDVSALNGLSSILIYELELDAAQFFNERAITLSQKQGIPYDAALHDQRLIAWMKQQQRGRAALIT